MGVTGLWSIVAPAARPTKVETLNRKRLAIDASMYFLKAVRDKEGNALRNSHVVGFFRRICKLLFFGIKPVFVFDGGAPALKRQTITQRKRRREGRRDDAVRTAGRLLAVQMQRRAEEDEQRRKDAQSRRVEEEEEAVPENLVYVDELQMTQQERQQNRTFRKKDAYHLPEMGNMHEMGGPNDPRVMSLEELEAYARQFDTGEDINVYDFSKIDYDSAFFMSLPASDRYNILNAARLRSRLRMGHSKEQLDSMFPDRMAFSRFQIDRVRERNELTTRLMNINDGDIKYTGAGNRVAGERAREYVLVKNDGVEGGYALCVISDEGTKRETAIDLEKPAFIAKQESNESEDEGFEDVPIEGLNRLPKRQKLDDRSIAVPSGSRRNGFRSRGLGGTGRRKVKRRDRPAADTLDDDPQSLFVADVPGEVTDEEEVDWEEIDGNVDSELFGQEGNHGDEVDDEELQRAIAMSLDQTEGEAAQAGIQDGEQLESEDWYGSFHQRAAEQARPVPKGSARDIAHVLNKRANATAPDNREVTSFGVPVAKPDDDVAMSGDSGDDEEEDAMDFQAALAESRAGKRKATPPPRRVPGSSASPAKTRMHQQGQGKNATLQKATADSNTFRGPLPFEKLDLGSSLLGKKKMQKHTEEAEGGFERADAADKAAAKREPLPPWFSGDLEEGLARQEALERADRERAKKFSRQFQFDGRRGDSVLGQGGREEPEVIDLEKDGEDGRESGKQTSAAKLAFGGVEKEVIELDDDDDDDDDDEEPELTGKPVDDEIRMGDMADLVRVKPPVPDTRSREQSGRGAPLPFEVDEESSEAELPSSRRVRETPRSQKAAIPFEVDENGDDMGDEPTTGRNPAAAKERSLASSVEEQDEDEENIDWSDSDGGSIAEATASNHDGMPAGGKRVAAKTAVSPPIVFEELPATDDQPLTESPSLGRSLSPVFEDVDMSKRIPAAIRSPTSGEAISENERQSPTPATNLERQETLPEDDNEFDDFSDPEEEELLKALTLEAEEHARFASTLNQKSAAQNIAEYETELKQLRNQQKKDRRDADEVTHIMITECQQLLRLFGLPYVTAPMEAEAQCAELVHLGLVDGIVTDDSDCFLFGGTRVYKNMFNQAKFVECYLASDLEREFDLTREKMIAVAQLLGSDYTEGLAGVGPVTALEILSEFPGGLAEFRDWWGAVQMQSIPKEADKGNPFRRKFRKNATKMFLPSVFPDPRVEMAYREPEVDSDPAPFQWGVPDLDALRTFLMATIGWSQERTDEVLVPVIRDMNRRADEGTQANITAFFDGGVGVGAAASTGKKGAEGFAPKRREVGSKRMGMALGRLKERAKVQRGLGAGAVVARETGVDMSAVQVANAEEQDVQVSAKKLKGKKRAPEVEPAETEGDEEGSEFEAPRKKTKSKRAAGSRGARAGKAGRRKTTAPADFDEDDE
ncbi:hypothetical protein LTR62_006812 [Meristemomyces frigidus]|uniref:Uncharacterized protein n=1 Tax=Meristemomyces frigidus TaxID=1508187 RepID=A0AAN7YPQ1_9PEZI|nr:hypothetical protein LTR62_006812 [Meristemomyces frigidus]